MKIFPRSARRSLRSNDMSNKFCSCSKKCAKCGGDLKRADHNRAKIYFQILFFIGCTLCFVYQSFQLFSIYLSGKTVVEVREEDFKYSQIPAVTICLPTLLDMRKFDQNYLQNSTKAQHLELHENFTSFDERPKIWDKSDHDQCDELYLKMLKVFRELPQENVSIIEIFDKISVDDLNLSEKELNWTFSGYNSSGDVVMIPLPIVKRSILPLGYPRVCFTYFSDQDENYRDSRWKVYQIFMVFTPDNLTKLSSKYNDVAITLHSPNTLPIFLMENQFKKIEVNKESTITYSERRTTLLPPPFETNCKYYPIDNMRSDLITRCVNDKLDAEFDLGCIWSFHNFRLIRRDYLFEYPNKTICDYMKIEKQRKQTDPEFYTNIRKRQLELNNECQAQFQKDCVDRFYSFEIGTKASKKWDHHNIFIKITHSRFADHSNEHMPVMDWITLVSNLGGLMGIWLGFSIFFLCNELICKVLK